MWVHLSYISSKSLITSLVHFFNVTCFQNKWSLTRHSFNIEAIVFNGIFFHCLYSIALGHFFNRTFFNFTQQSISSTPYVYLYKDISAMGLLFNVLFLQQNISLVAHCWRFFEHLISWAEHFFNTLWISVQGHFCNETLIQCLISSTDAFLRCFIVDASSTDAFHQQMHFFGASLLTLLHVLFLRQMHFFGASLLTLLYRLISATQHFFHLFFL